MKLIYLLLACFLHVGIAEESTDYALNMAFPHTDPELVSDNYAWLPHNVDPENNLTPDEYIGKPIQYLGNRRKVYEDYIQGCRDFWDEKYEGTSRSGTKCMYNNYKII